MILSTLLLWLTIVLVVGAAARTRDHASGLALGCVCSVFWVALLRATGSVRAWDDPWTIGATVMGVVAMALVGAVSGRASVAKAANASGLREVNASSLTARAAEDRRFLSSIARAMGRYDDWLENVSCSKDPWADFGEYLRGVLFDTVGATHVQPFRVVCDGAQLEPLHRTDAMDVTTRTVCEDGVMGRVLATGASYVRGVSDEADQRQEWVGGGKKVPAWCFAVVCKANKFGVVSVGKTDLCLAAHPEATLVVERLIGQVWSSFIVKLDERSARVTDATSMLATRDAFMRDAHIALRESYAQEEPVAIAVLATQGLRRLTDAGRWEVADDVLHTIGTVIRRKVRLDDCVGRIDESRVVWLLRRVDVDLAGLVVGQLVSHVNDAISSCQAVAGTVRVDCGVATTDSSDLPLRAFLVRALEAARRARVEQKSIVLLESCDNSPDGFERSVSGAS